MSDTKGSAEETWNAFVRFVADALEAELIPTAHELSKGENDWNRAVNEGIRHCIRKVRDLEIREPDGGRFGGVPDHEEERYQDDGD